MADAIDIFARTLFVGPSREAWSKNRYFSYFTKMPNYNEAENIN